MAGSKIPTDKSRVETRKRGIVHRTLPNEVSDAIGLTTSLAFVDGHLICVRDSELTFVSPAGEIASCTLSAVSRVASGTREAAFLITEDDRTGSLVALQPNGQARYIKVDLPPVSDMVVHGQSVLLSLAPTMRHPASVLTIDLAKPEAAPRPITLNADHPITFANAGHTTILALDEHCKRWWWIDPSSCQVVEEGSGSPPQPHHGAQTRATPGGRIDRSGEQPCGTTLIHPIGKMISARQALIAIGPTGRELTILDSQSLERKLEHQFGRHGAELFLDDGSQVLHTFDRERKVWIDFILDDLFIPFLPGRPIEPVTVEEAVSIGRASQALIADRRTAVGEQKILVLPVVEPGNPVGDPELLKQYLEDDVVSPLAEYYLDASKSQLQLSGSVYGFDAIDTMRGPLSLSRPFAGFWNGAIEPGGFSVQIPDVAAPPLVAFDGLGEFVVDFTDPTLGLTDERLTITPPAGRLIFSDVLDSSGTGTLEIPVGASISVVHDVAGVPSSMAAPLAATSYSLPADIGRFQTDVNAALEAAAMSAGLGPDHRQRARCRLVPRERDVSVDLHYLNPSASARYVRDITVTPTDPQLADIQVGVFRFSRFHGTASFELEGYLRDATIASLLDVGADPPSVGIVRMRVEDIGSNFELTITAARFDGSLDFVHHSGLSLLGFDSITPVTRGFECSLVLAVEPEPLRFDGSERATGTSDRGVAFDIRIPALHGRGGLPLDPTSQVDFGGIDASMTVDGTTHPLVFPAEMVDATAPALTTYLNRVFAGSSLPASADVEADVRILDDGHAQTRLFFTNAPAGGPRTVSLTAADTSSLPGFYVGFHTLSPTQEITFPSLGSLEDDLEVAAAAAPFNRPEAVRSGNDVVVTFEFDLTQAGSRNFATVSSVVGLERFGFNSATTIVANDVPIGRQWAPNSFRDFGSELGLGTEVITALHDRHGPDVARVLDEMAEFHSIMLVLVGEPPTAGAWSAAPTSLTRQRVFASGQGVASRRDNDLSIDTNWFLVALDGANEIATTVHEFGHAIGLYDLYPIEGVHRPDLEYMESLCVMHISDSLNTICGYHKFGTTWIDTPLEIAPASGDTSVILYPLEYDVGPGERAALVNAVASAFGQPASDVHTSVKLSLGGGMAPFGLIEARQRPPALFGRSLPRDGGVLVSHCMDHSDDTRLRETGGYRRQAHPIVRPNSLNSVGDEVALGALRTLPIGGTTVKVDEVVEVSHAGQTFNAFRLTVERVEAAVLDLFFDESDPPWKAPDVWIDDPNDDVGITDHPLGQPTNQGDVVTVPENPGTIRHLIRARVHNGSTFAVPEVKVAFYLCSPPGSGDRGNFIRLGESTARDVDSNDVAIAEIDWNVANGDRGHQCVRAEIFDWTLPAVVSGDPGFTGDITDGNNTAQKNVDQFDEGMASPYEPVSFQYSVANDGPTAELVRLQPAGLQPGMKLTVSPATQIVEPDTIAYFDCTLELDIDIVDAGCKADTEYLLSAWRQTGDSWERWGGCNYIIRPRRKTSISFDPSYGYGRLHVSGVVAPSPGTGTVEVHLTPDGGPLQRHSRLVSSLGNFSLDLEDFDYDFVDVSVRFLGNETYAESRSTSQRVYQSRLI